MIFFISELNAQSDSDTTGTSGITFFGYPYLFYTPETNLAFGAGGMMYFRTAKQSDLNLSNILLSGYYTINNQYNLTLSPELYFAHNRYIVRGEFSFGKFLDKFYGYGSNAKKISNPDYFTQDFGINLNFQADVSEKFEIGAIYDFLYTSIIDKKSNPFLLNESVLGSNGGISSGLGIKFVWDSRNYVYLPTSGGYYMFSVVYYVKALGSDYEFNNYLLDLRRYFKITEGHIVTVQLYGNFTGGNPPFYEVPRLGGSVTMRGYYEGRYRDRYFVTAQAEYKTWLVKKWKLGVVVFGGLGDVAYNFRDFILRGFKYSYGLGVRYIFDKKERLTVRADFAFGKNTSGVYFAIQEAF
ncbi:MAG: BamA/TamA family outer membrane protein [Chlorobi bacterium]|nr:BamA/TamA family outer membrane protein [Chlorobiota bacterium]